MSSRIQAARDRLNAALLAGEDTTPHRRAIESLTMKEQAEAEREMEKQEQRDDEISDLVSARAESLAAETRHRLDSIIEQFPIPNRP